MCCEFENVLCALSLWARHFHKIRIILTKLLHQCKLRTQDPSDVHWSTGHGRRSQITVELVLGLLPAGIRLIMQSRRRQLRNSSVHFRNYGTHVNMLGAGFSCSSAQVLANLTIFHDYKQIIIGRSVSELAARKTTVQTLKVGGWLSTLLLL